MCIILLYTYFYFLNDTTTILMEHFLKSTLVFFVILVTYGCSENQELNPLPNAQNTLEQDMDPDGKPYNYEQLGEFVYHQIKYYAATLDAYQFYPEEQRDQFIDKREELKTMVSANGWELEETISFLGEEGYYTERQALILYDQQTQLEEFLVGSEPTGSEAWNWCLNKEEEIKNDDLLSFTEKNQLLNERAVIRYLLKYRLENINIHKEDNPENGRVAASQSVCGFWEQLACWTGAITGLSGISGMASKFVAKAAEATFGMIGAAIGVVVGVFNGIQNCQCNNNGVCQPFTGIAFDYECYNPGGNLRFKGWGYGNVSPSQFFWEFYKNNNASNGSNFYSNFTGSDYIDLPGSQISSNSVSSVAVHTENYCGTQWLQSLRFGWYYLDELGKPFFAISGESYISSSSTNYSRRYVASGPLDISPNTTVRWEILSSGLPGYSATGTLSSTTSKAVNINWDSTPGIATLKCTATSPCATVVKYFDVQIYGSTTTLTH